MTHPKILILAALLGSFHPGLLPAQLPAEPNRLKLLELEFAPNNSLVYLTVSSNGKDQVYGKKLTEEESLQNILRELPPLTHRKEMRHEVYIRRYNREIGHEMVLPVQWDDRT